MIAAASEGDNLWIPCIQCIKWSICRPMAI